MITLSRKTRGAFAYKLSCGCTISALRHLVRIANTIECPYMHGRSFIIETIHFSRSEVE